MEAKDHIGAIIKRFLTYLIRLRGNHNASQGGASIEGSGAYRFYTRRQNDLLDMSRVSERVIVDSADTVLPCRGGDLKDLLSAGIILYTNLTIVENREQVITLFQKCLDIKYRRVTVGLPYRRKRFRFKANVDDTTSEECQGMNLGYRSRQQEVPQRITS